LVDRDQEVSNQAEIARLESRIDHLITQIDHLRSETDALKSDNGRLQETVDDLFTEQDAIRASATWRLGSALLAPLRLVRRGWK
jgi:cell division protein FtsB